MITDLSRLCFICFFLLAIGNRQLAMGRLLYALRFYSGFISFFDFIRFMLLGSPPFSGGSAVMLVGFLGGVAPRTKPLGCVF